MRDKKNFSATAGSGVWMWPWPDARPVLVQKNGSGFEYLKDCTTIVYPLLTSAINSSTNSLKKLPLLTSGVNFFNSFLELTSAIYFCCKYNRANVERSLPPYKLTLSCKCRSFADFFKPVRSHRPFKYSRRRLGIFADIQYVGMNSYWRDYANVMVSRSVADPHRKNADADPGKYLDADADPDADANSCPYWTRASQIILSKIFKVNRFVESNKMFKNFIFYHIILIIALVIHISTLQWVAGSECGSSWQKSCGCGSAKLVSWICIFCSALCRDSKTKLP